MAIILPSAAVMRLAGKHLMVSSALTVIGALLGQSAQAVPLAVYGHLPNIEDVALSPDGSRLAYVRR